jgi:hypothetical protein
MNFANDSSTARSNQQPNRTITIELVEMASSGHAKYIAAIMSITIAICLVGNSINILVFSKRHMRKMSTFRFLIYLSVFDMLVLLVCSTEAFAQLGFHFEICHLSNLTCRVHTFLTYFLPHCSSNILMAISIDRALVMCAKFLKIFAGNKYRPELTFNI